MGFVMASSNRTVQGFEISISATVVKGGWVWDYIIYKICVNSRYEFEFKIKRAVSCFSIETILPFYDFMFNKSGKIYIWKKKQHKMKVNIFP